MIDPSSVHDLPKFSGTDTACPKCASETKTHPKYSTRVSQTGLREEWLARWCTICSYQWNERVVDAPRTNGDTPPIDFLDIAKKFLADDTLGKFVSALLKEK